MDLPFLPGFSPNRQLGIDRFHKTQRCDVSHGAAMLLDPDQNQRNHSLYPTAGRGTHLPSWIAFDKQALSFDAYFQEEVPEAPEESERVRRCKILFYLEDDTIRVEEPHTKNSGIPQGTLIHRQRVPLPPPDHQRFYTVYHFNVGQQVTLWSRTFTLTDCDAFTRNFLTKLGVTVNAPISAPADAYSSLQEQREKSLNPLRPYQKHNTLKQFLDNDGKVLRFSCLWDDSESMFGDSRELVLQYFLADDTVEILEIVPRNCGRDHAPKFLRRGKLPKRVPAVMKQPGEATKSTVLNVVCSDSQEPRYMLDNLKSDSVQEACYKDSDLSIGVELNVWGRRVVLTDCDDFTKDHYRSTYGIEDFTPVQYKASPASRPPRPPPPYNGFGSEEDSLSSCQGLLPKRPQKDFRKFMEKDRYGMDSKVLSFRARMLTLNPDDMKRRFSISYFLSDDSISISEYTQKNSGMLGGRFLQRSRVKKPGQEVFKSSSSEYFAAQDMYLGATLSIKGFDFLLLEANEYTLRYMEQHAEEFPKANMRNIVSKLRSVPEDKQAELKKFFTLSDPSSSGFLPYDSFRTQLMGLGCGLSEHEVQVLARGFSQGSLPQEDIGLMLAVTQEILRKKDFQQFPELTTAFIQRDQHGTGHLSTKETRTIFKGFRLPLTENLLNALVSRFSEGEQLDYNAFLAGINWMEHPAAPVLPDDILKFEVNARSDGGGASGGNVNYSALLQEVFNVTSHSANAPDAAATGMQ